MGKGKGKAHIPWEQPDNLKSSQTLSIVDLLCEGQVEGPVGGLRGVFLNDTPIQNANGSNNFSGITAQWLAGMQDQPCLEGFPAIENEVPVSLEVKYGKPLIRTITDGNVDQLRVTVGVGALFQQNNEGDIHGSRVVLQVQVGSGEQWQPRETVVISGKIRSQYLRSVLIGNLPPAPFNLRVVRVTNDSSNSKLENKTLWSSYTEIINTRLNYPNTALVGLAFDSSQFQGVPRRNYLIRGLMIKVPSNYQPGTRSYSGIWDGTFKIAWSNNPAWIFYDLVMNERYGLGKRVGNFGCDKWAMYRIGQYCDQLVDDGLGGKEPRMTCNCYITDRRQAHDLINDLASVFRTMPVWDGLQMSCIQDRPADPVWRYTNANVVDGSFSYQSSAQKARHTTIHVRYIDPHNGWKTATEYVADDQMIARYGLNVLEVDAFGCTSRGQAQRTGKWILHTERLEKQSVSFKVGREGIRHLPGDIIEIADNDYAGARIGGRVHALNGRTITLDREVTLDSKQRNTLGYIDTTGKPARVEILSQPKANQLLLISTVAELQVNSVWTLATANRQPRLFRALSIAENEDGSYSISALQHVAEKEAVVDSGVRFDPKPESKYSDSLPPVEHLRVEPVSESEIIQARAYWSTPTVNQGISYQVKVTHAGAVVLREQTADTEFLLSGLSPAEYQISVRCRGADGRLGEETRVDFTLQPPAPPVSIDVTPGVGRITLRPHFAGIVAFNTLFEFWYAEKKLMLDQVESQAIKLVTGSYYIHDRLKHGKTYYYYVRSINAYGKSTFIGVSAQTSDDAGEILDVIANQVMSSEAGKALANDVADNNQQLHQMAEAVIQTALAGDAQVQRSYKQQGETEASISEVRQVIADGEKATATQISGLTSKIGNVSANVQQVAKTVVDLDGKVSASYNIKVAVDKNGKQYAAGMGIGVENTPQGMQSQVLFMADRFAFLNQQNGSTTTPFVIDGGKTFINEALIKGASITNAKIANASITSAKIADASITSAKIADAQVDTLRIKGNAVIIPSAFSWHGLKCGNHNMEQILSGSVDYPYHTRVIVIVAIRQRYFRQRGTAAQIRVDGQVRATFGAGAYNNAPVMMCNVSLAPGSHSFAVDWRGEGYRVILSSINMAVWGAMR